MSARRPDPLTALTWAAAVALFQAVVALIAWQARHPLSTEPLPWP